MDAVKTGRKKDAQFREKPSSNEYSILHVTDVLAKRKTAKQTSLLLPLAQKEPMGEVIQHQGQHQGQRTAKTQLSPGLG